MIERSLLALLLVDLLIGVIAVVKPFTTAILFGAALATAVSAGSVGRLCQSDRRFHQTLAHRLWRRDAAVAKLSWVCLAGSSLLALGPVHRADSDRHRIYPFSGVASRGLRSSQRRVHQARGIAVRDSRSAL